MFLKNLVDTPEYVSGTKGKDNFIRLSSNENNYGPSPKVIKLLKNISYLSYRYPNSSYLDLKEVLAEENKVLPSNIILGNGSDEIFLNLFLIYLEPTQNVITIEKTFTYYKIIASIIGAKVIETKRGERFSISCEEILNSVSKDTKIIIFPSPDNPTGVITSRECIEKILKNIPETTLFILDEAYFHFVPRNKYWDSTDLVKKYPNFIITRTFSKLFGLAGLRIGYGICSEEISKLYNKIRMPFNVSLLAVEAAKVAIKDKKYYSKILKKIVTDREKLKTEFKKMGLDVLEESYGNFIFLQGKENLDKELLRQGIVIRNLKSFGYDETFYRITIGTTQQNKILLNNMKKIIGAER